MLLLNVHLTLRQCPHAQRSAVREVSRPIERTHRDVVRRACGQAAQIIRCGRATDRRHVRTVAINVVRSDPQIVRSRRPRHARARFRHVG